MTEPAADPAPARSRRRRVLFTLLCVVLGPLLLVGLDHLVGWLLPSPPRHLLFPSGSRIEHESCEFRVEVAISEQGLRDRDYPPTPAAGTRRIVAVGDSFTFGWGVALEDSWPKRLEAALADTEVLNFGFPGASPTDYLWMTEAAIRNFEPQTVLIGTLQGDDLVQLVEQLLEQGTAEVPWTRRAAGAAFPTLTRWLQRVPEPMESYRSVFRKSQSYIRSTLTPPQQARYAELSAEVRQCFEAGLLNPSLVQSALAHPDRLSRPVTAGGAWQKQAEGAWRDCLVQLKRLCDAHGARLQIVIVPDGPHVSADSAAGLRELGYEIPESLLKSNVPEQIISRVCVELGIDLLNPVPAFRQAEAGDYFPLDGHMTARGHARLAEQVAGALGDPPRE